jgi:actin-related protein
MDTWEALFEQQLMISCSDHSFVMSTLPDMTPTSRSTMIETMFEHFNAPCLRTESPAVLSLHALGLRDGLVIDCGNRLSVTPIVEGYVFEQATHRSFYGGLELTAELRRRLMDSGVDAAGLGNGNFECSNVVRSLKEKYCHVAPFGHAAADSLVSFDAAKRQRCIIGPARATGSPARTSSCVPSSDDSHTRASRLALLGLTVMSA